MAEEEVGRVTHYYGQIGVAAIEVLKGNLSIGDRIRIRGHTTDFSQGISSMEIDYKPVERVGSGEVVAVRTIQSTRSSDRVYRLKELDRDSP